MYTKLVLEKALIGCEDSICFSLTFDFKMLLFTLLLFNLVLPLIFSGWKAELSRFYFSMESYRLIQMDRLLGLILSQ